MRFLMSNLKTLIPLTERSKADAKKIRQKGQKAMIKKKKEKKMMSDLYASFLCEEHKIKQGDKEELLTGYDMIGRVVGKVLSRGGSSAVSMMREIREAMEGSKIHHMGKEEIEIILPPELKDEN